MSIKLLKTTFKLVRTFFAVVSTIPFAHTKLRGYPFAKPIYALDKDWLEIGSDIEITTQKTKK